MSAPKPTPRGVGLGAVFRGTNKFGSSERKVLLNGFVRIASIKHPKLNGFILAHLRLNTAICQQL